jgi:hypothetical protein
MAADSEGRSWCMTVAPVDWDPEPRGEVSSSGHTESMPCKRPQGREVRSRHDGRYPVVDPPVLDGRRPALLPARPTATTIRSGAACPQQVAAAHNTVSEGVKLMFDRSSRGRFGALVSAFCALAALSSCVVTRLEPPIAGYTCCNLRSTHGWISSNNVQGGVLVPPGEPVRLDQIRKQYYAYGTVGSVEVAFRDDGASSQKDTLQWLRQVVVADDPRGRLAGWSSPVRRAVGSARVMVGMTRDQVLMSLGHPARADTPELGADTWRYWTALEDLPVDLRFGPDGTLLAVSGKESAVRTLVQEP